MTRLMAWLFGRPRRAPVPWPNVTVDDGRPCPFTNMTGAELDDFEEWYR